MESTIFLFIVRTIKTHFQSLHKTIVTNRPFYLWYCLYLLPFGISSERDSEWHRPSRI